MIESLKHVQLHCSSFDLIGGVEFASSVGGIRSWQTAIDSLRKHDVKIVAAWGLKRIGYGPSWMLSSH